MIDRSIKTVLSNLKIIYVEDDDAIRNYICEFFKRFHTEIYCTSSAEEGLDLYKEHNPDIVITDINLPGISGIEMITQIRNSDKFTRAIVTTAYTNPEFTLQAIELSITRYLVKPLTSNNLLPAIQKAVEELNNISNHYLNISLGKGFSFNIKSDQLFQYDNEIELRKKELDLLKYFILNENQTVTYSMLENNIWEDQIMTNDAVRGQIRNLRKKIYPEIVKNISGVGYKITFGEELQ